MISINRTNDTWILEKHSNNIEHIIYYLKVIKDNKGDTSKENLEKYLKLANFDGIYTPRYKGFSYATMSNKAGVIRAYNLGIQRNAGAGQKQFLIGPYGELILKHYKSIKNLKKIIFTNFYFAQYPHPKYTTQPEFRIFPWRLVFGLLQESKLDKTLYDNEMVYFLPFIKNLKSISYEELLESILSFRNLSTSEKEEKFNEEVNIGSQSNIQIFQEFGFDMIESQKKASEIKWADLTHQFQYTLNLFKELGILNSTETGKENVITFNQATPRANQPTPRRLSKNYSLDSGLEEYFDLLQERYSKEQVVTKEDLLEIDFEFKIITKVPDILLKELGEEPLEFVGFDSPLEVEGDIERMEYLSSQSENMSDYTEFEERIAAVMNRFNNIRAEALGGSGRTDVECLDLNKNDKFNIEAKSTQSSLPSVNPSRINNHMEQNDALFTLIVTTAFAEGVRRDIQNEKISIVTTKVFAELIRNHVVANDLDSFDEIRDIIEENLGQPSSLPLFEYILSKFGSTFTLDN